MGCQVVESSDHASRLHQSVIQEFIVAHWVFQIRSKLSTVQCHVNSLWNLTTWHWAHDVINDVGIFRVRKELGKAGIVSKLCECLKEKVSQI